MQDLHSKVVIVTGGASGMGRATCSALAREGAAVVVVDVHQENIDATLRDLREIREEQDAFLGLLLDVRDERAMESMAERTIEKFDRIDALVASAGILRGTGSSPMPLARISTSEWEQVLDTNLKGMFLSNRAVLPTMIKQRAGDIINISSVSGKQGRAHDAPYCASKFGVIGMSESLAEEARGYGVRVQIIMPDAVDTPMWDQNGPVPCPSDALPPERVAELIVYMLKQPSDTMLLGVTIALFRSRRRKKSRSADRSVKSEGSALKTAPGPSTSAGTPPL